MMPRSIENTKALEFNLHSASKLRDLSSSFMRNFGVTGICYLRYFKDGKIFRMGTIEEWTKKFFQKELYNSTNGEDQKNLLLSIKNKEHVVVQTGKPEGEIAEILYNLGIWNNCGFFRSYPSYVEAFFLAGKNESPGIVDLFLNNRNLINHFALYIKDKMAGEINNTTTYINSGLRYSELLSGHQQELDNRREWKKMFLDSASISRYYLNTSEGDISLSPREYGVLQLLCTGMTTKEIARTFNLSPRTVESYLNSAKIKLGCANKSELIKVFNETALNDQILFVNHSKL